MRILTMTQGSPEWLAIRADHFTASEAPAMMGKSKYQTRDELLNVKATGESKPVDEYTQKLFDNGHKTEEMARPLVESMIGEELFPATVVAEDGSDLLASLDGMTICDDVLFEHKMWNAKLAEQVQVGDLDPHYYWQLEQQLLVTGAEKVIFVVSDGTLDNFESMEYYPVEGRAAELIKGWEQFKIDLANYTPQVTAEKPEPAPVKSLPAISFKFNGMSLSSNIDIYRESAEQLVEDSKLPLETDQDFADRESLIKEFKDAEAKIKLVQGQVLAEVVDVDTFTKELGHIGELIRQARLNGEKQVKQRKDEIKQEVMQSAKQQLADHCAAINERIAPVSLSLSSASFAGAIKGKRALDSIQSAVNDELARAKIEANSEGETIHKNLATLNEMAADYKMLFADIQQIITKDHGDLVNLISMRISQHKEEVAREAEKIAEANRLKEIAEQSKADAEAEYAANIERMQVELDNEKERMAMHHQEEKHDLCTGSEFPSGEPLEELPRSTVSRSPVTEESRLQSIEQQVEAWADRNGVSGQALSELMKIISQPRVIAA